MNVLDILMTFFTRCLLCCFILFFAISGSSNAQDDKNTWRVMPVRSIEEFEADAFGGEGEQHPHSIARSLNHPEYIYLSHDVGGSWRSTDNGDSWRKNLDKGLALQFGQSIEADPNNPDIVFLIVDPSYNYKADGYQGLYRSEDGGKSWKIVLQTQTKIERMYRHNIAYELSSADAGEAVKTWYAAFMNNGLYRSDDGGISWGDAPVADLKDHDIIYEIRAHPSDPKVVFVASNLGLFKSSEKGANLQRISSLPENISSVCVNPRHPDSIFVTAYSDGLYLSTDNGATFNKILDHPSVRLHQNHGFPERLYLTGNSRNSKYSEDGGATWKDFPVLQTFPGLGRETGWRRWFDGKISGIVSNPNDKNEAVCFTRSTIYKTTDGGESYFESATGWTGNAWSWTDNSMVFDRFDPDKFAFFCNDVGTRITTSGGEWFHENTNAQAGQWYPSKIKWYGTYSGDFYPEKGSEIMVASIGGYFKTQLMRTENLGESWELVTEGNDNEEMNLFISFNPEDPNIVYAGSKFSTDGGKTFEKFPFPEEYDSPYVIAMCKSYPDIIYALNKACTVILRSCDQGQNWEEYAKPGWNFRPFDPLPTFAADPINPKKVYTLDANHDLASFDGENWTSFDVMDNIDNDIPFNFVRNVAIDPNNPAIIYAGMFASGGSIVLRSLDAGNTWEDISYNLARMGGALKVNPHTGELFRGSMFGTWIFPAPYDTVPQPGPKLLTGVRIIQLKDTIIIGEQMQFSAEDLTGCFGDENIHWESDSPAIASVDQSGNVEAKATGFCKIKASLPGGKYFGECFLYVTAPNSIAENTVNRRSDIIIYPNPADNQLHIAGNLSENMSFKIMDITGSVCLQSDVRDSGKIDISGLEQGVYIIRIVAGQKIAALLFNVGR